MGLFDDIKAEPTAPASAGLFDDIPVQSAPEPVQMAATDAMGAPTGAVETIPAPSPPKAAPPAPMATKTGSLGILDTLGRSAVQGLTFGLADESYGLTQGIKGLLSGEGFGSGYTRGVDEFRGREKAGKAENPIAGLVGEVGGGMATGLGAARAGLTLMQRGMNLPQMIGRGAVEGGLYGAAYGAGNAEGGLAGRLEGALDSGKLGFGVGAAVPMVARGLGAATRVISPLTTTPERQAMADILRNEGVSLTAGQRSGSTPLRYAESILGDAPLAGGQASGVMTRQGEEFTEAALRRAGGAGRASPDNMLAISDRIGQQFRDLSGRNTMQADPQLARDIGSTLREYDRVLPAERRAIIGNLASDIVERFQAGSGRMPGQDYQTIRSRLSRLSKNARQGDPDYADALRGLRDAMDNGMTRSITPEDAGAWQQARREWGNYKTLEKAASGAGSDTALGLISPSALRNAATVRDRGAYVRGQGDFADLARAGEALLKPLPNSGTGQRNLITGLVGGGAGTVGATGNLPLAAAMAVAPGLAGRALYSSPVQRWLGNQALGAASREQFEANLRSLLLGGGQSQSQKLNSPRD